MPRSVSVQTRRRKLTRAAIDKLAAGRPVSRVEAFGTPLKKDQRWTFAVLRHWLDTGDIQRSGNQYVLVANPGTFKRRYTVDKVIDRLIDGDTATVNSEDVEAAAREAEQAYDAAEQAYGSVKDLVAAVKRRKSDGTVVPATFEGMPPKPPTVELADEASEVEAVEVETVEVDEQPASGDEQCAFCLSYVNEVGEMLIASRPGVYICKDCVKQAVGVFAIDAPVPPAPPPALPPPTASTEGRNGDVTNLDDDSSDATDKELLKGIVVWLSDVSERLDTMTKQQEQFQTWVRSMWE